jgi:hypothetical protein
MMQPQDAPMECADMTRNNFVTALGLAFLTFMLSAHYAVAGVCPEGTNETYSFKYARNICYPDAQTLQACQSKYGYWNYEAGQCLPRPVKNIGKKKPQTSGGVGGGSTDCGPGYSYDPERGCRKIKSLGKKKVMPGTSGGAGGE